ncbi:MAG: VWA domain-containing protein [Myxococcales bacterium]|nr:VWA domain-containing protein [Myxococcales bacterium]
MTTTYRTKIRIGCVGVIVFGALVLGCSAKDEGLGTAQLQQDGQGSDGTLADTQPGDTAQTDWSDGSDVVDGDVTTPKDGSEDGASEDGSPLDDTTGPDVTIGEDATVPTGSPCVDPFTGACAACDADADCQTGRCVVIDGEQRCAAECAEIGDCGPGYTCESVPAGDATATVCVPPAGTCSCCAETDGEKRPCDGDGPEFGNCDGVQTCVGATGWSTCAAFTPGAEACDTIDNDCDGETDEDFKDALGQLAQDAHCGECGNDCAAAAGHGTSACAVTASGPSCEVVACDLGYLLDGGLCVPGVAPGGVCGACTTDDDCDDGTCVVLDGESVCLPACGSAVCPAGFACGAVGGESVCRPPSGTCSCTAATDGAARACAASGDGGDCPGIESCDAAVGWGPCSATAPSAELCDGLDNDCDGVVDDGVTPAEAGTCDITVTGVGTCGGTPACGGASGWICEGTPPELEACNGADDDCDGLTDEDFKNQTGAVGTDDHCGSCGNDCDGQIANGSAACGGSEFEPRCVAASCDAPYVLTPDGACSMPPSLSCASCSDDADCGGGSCVALAGALVCVMPCGEGGACADTATACANVDEAGLVKRCFPTSGACVCDAGNVGLERSCQTVNAVGTCVGRETCGADGAWAGCSAATANAETCNGLDDDCDGVVDDGLPTLEPCALSAEGIGACGGVHVCQGALGWACLGDAPTLEVCDLEDNDCDGQVDEGYLDISGAYLDDTHCGACGNDCTTAISGGVGRCGGDATAPVCVVDTCAEGLVPVSAFECGEPVVATCETCSVDADCGVGSACVVSAGTRVCAAPCQMGAAPCPSGYGCELVSGQARCLPASGSCDCTPESVGTTRSCAVTAPAGTCRGIQTCGASGWTACTAPVASTEVCNGYDDDCDGEIDEGAPPPAETCTSSNAVGSCTGAWACDVVWICTAPVAVVESCNDNDDDCDGEMDEDFRSGDGGLFLGDDHCGACGASCDAAIPNGDGACADVAGVPTCVVTSCDPGYLQTSAGDCAPVRTQCTPCTTDADCPQSGDVCLLLDGAQVCGSDCAAGNVYGTAAGECGAGFTCDDLGAGEQQCVPASGSCECLLSDAGETRACTLTNAAGTCGGTETCDPVAGFVGCTAKEPTTEACNGQDDDCDGGTDAPLVGALCASQAGVCAGASEPCGGPAGFEACTAATYGPNYEATEATCDALDNDCDGVTDEGYLDDATGLYLDDEACGSCSTSCTALYAVPDGHAYGRCVNAGGPACELVCCSPGDTHPACDGRTWTNVNGDPSDGCESSPCQNNLECGGNKFCDAGTCTVNASGGPCDDDINCPSGEQCVGGFCGCDGSLFTATKVPPNVLIVLDRSGSMNETISGKSKWSIAKTAIANLTTNFGSEVRFGLMLYPGTNKSGTQGGDCNAGAVFVNPTENAGSTITTFLSGAGTTSFGTPTAASLAWLANYAGLEDTTRENYILLITDGQSTCNNNPKNEVEALLAQTPSVKTFVVGFGSGVSATELNSMALAGGVPRPNGPPHYYKADSATDLETALAEIGGNVLSCDYVLNQVPADIEELFIFFDDVEQPRDPAHTAGWDYSLGTNTVTFYGSSCSALKSGSVNDLVMVYGCAGVIQ